MKFFGGLTQEQLDSISLEQLEELIAKKNAADKAFLEAADRLETSFDKVIDKLLAKIKEVKEKSNDRGN